MKSNIFFSKILDSIEMDELEQISRRNHLSFKSLELIYQFVLDRRCVTYVDTLNYLSQKDVNFTPKTFGKYVSALKIMGDIAISFEFSTDGYDGRWLVYAPGVISDLCKKRHISLLSYVRMNDLWERFYAEAESYFDFRQKRVKPPETLTSIKERYAIEVERLGHNGTSHKYVRTALDMVVMEIGDMRRIIANIERNKDENCG